MLRLQNYKKTYGSVTVLAVDHLQLAPGIHWLMGENGSGKTTLLQSIAGLIPFEGTIEVEGLNLRRQRKRYTICVSFAEAEPVYPAFLNGADLLHFYLQTKGGTKEQMALLAEALGIAPYLTNNIETYSSGMQKKLSLLLSFAGSPKLIILDEPFITLDEKAVTILRELIVRYHQQGVSFLISSHQALALAVPLNRLQISQKTIKQEHYVVVA